MDIDQTEDKGGKSETAETERSRICELAEQALMGFGVKILGRGREDGRLVGLGISAGVGRFAAVVEVMVGLEIAGAIILVCGHGRHCESERTLTIKSEELEEKCLLLELVLFDSSGRAYIRPRVERWAVSCIYKNFGKKGCVGGLNNRIPVLWFILLPFVHSRSGLRMCAYYLRVCIAINGNIIR